MEKETDIYRDTIIRYLGYANEVGEAFRNLVSLNSVRASYAVAIGYCLADTCDKTLKKYRQETPPVQVAVTAVDVLIWQMFASVIIPGFTINRITHFTRYALKEHKIRGKMLAYMPTVVGLLSIPVIVHPIDTFVDFSMDNTIRKIMKTN